MNVDFQTVVNSVGDLPPMPAVAVKVIEQLQDSTTSAAGLADTVAHDPALSARVLKIANSSFYSMKRQVKTLESAIVLLGERTLRSLVLAASLKGMNKSFGLLEKMLWEDSIGCAIGAKVLARRFDTVDSEEAFLGGLFRHIGKVVLNYSRPETFQDLMQAVYNGEGSIQELERRYFPYSHALVGAAVLKKWNFSDSLIECTLHHADLNIDEREEPSLYRLTATVHLAGAICTKLGIGQRSPDENLELATQPSAQALGLDIGELADTLDAIRIVFNENRSYFLG
ncbi:HDOD domain-containing protein [Geoalkalibacter halelectricus]|uniref:HDOD domain-containing protein n=1 Tax=Geoalkalibacter halelectricus TaxID=2847045 RepID=A0ABY5ZQE0_9BACT|nr:HDOD domain-containing protein [Geoalkalibacter halelectricus]MDO3376661.1 HDOD domain-containing protein [Geoalkalibacter halelectricus]UWZ81387.1 HDOD domain-containing protein [Geoalkalibacter halelectricus]